jgi:Transposase IS116/IS110/IS902 family
MRFYTQQHRYYCGIDLHARSIYLCIMDQAGEILLHRNMRANPNSFLKAVAPYREDLVVSVECMFTWYWLADLCRSEKIAFVLGHALYMKAIHGGKAKCARESAGKISGTGGRKIGNAHLKWAFSQAAVGFLRKNPDGKKYYARLERKHGKGKALTVLAHKLARAVYYIWKKDTVFDQEKFLAA